MISERNLQSNFPFFQVLRYEVERTYRDNLGSTEHKSQFDTILNKLFNEEWKNKMRVEGLDFSLV